MHGRTRLFFKTKKKDGFPYVVSGITARTQKKMLHKPAKQPGKKINLDRKNIQCQRKALDAYAWKLSLLSDLEVS